MILSRAYWSRLLRQSTVKLPSPAVLACQGSCGLVFDSCSSNVTTFEHAPRHNNSAGSVSKTKAVINEYGCMQLITGYRDDLSIPMELPRYLASEVRYIAALASSQLAGTQPFTCDSASQATPRSNKSCGSLQGSGARDEARVHVNPEKLPDWVGYSTFTGCGCTSSLSENLIFLDIYRCVGNR